jgi:hypothetical protein
MPIPDAIRDTFNRTWNFIWPLAAAKTEDGAYGFAATDISSIAKSQAAATGEQLTFEDYRNMAVIFGWARRIETAADRLTAAADEHTIEASHVAEAPYARPYTVQAAEPKWRLLQEYQVRLPDGNVITDWGTVTFDLVLPATVGDMRAEAELVLKRYLAKRSEERNTGGELLGLGRSKLLAV